MICYVSKFLNVIYRIYHFPIDSEPNKILFISESTEKWYLQSDFELIYQDWEWSSCVCTRCKEATSPILMRAGKIQSKNRSLDQNCFNAENKLEIEILVNLYRCKVYYDYDGEPSLS